MNGENKTTGGGAQHYVIVAIIAFALGLGAGWMWAGNKSESASQNATTTPTGETSTTSTTDTTDETTTTSGTQPSSIMTIVARDQAAGLTVAIESISAPTAVWAVVHEDNGSGQPSRILGAQLVEEGAATATVQLLRGTQAGQTYYAMIHNDNGDRAFDPKSDAAALGSDGKPVMSTFKATGETSANVEVGL